MLMFGSILALVIMISIALGFLYFPRSIKTFMGISYEDIEEIFVEVGYDTIHVYTLREDYKEEFYQRITKIKVMPTYSHMKAVPKAQFIIRTKKETYYLCNFYYKTSTSKREEFNLLDKEEFLSLYSLFPNVDINEYY